MVSLATWHLRSFRSKYRLIVGGLTFFNCSSSLRLQLKLAIYRRTLDKFAEMLDTLFADILAVLWSLLVGNRRLFHPFLDHIRKGRPFAFAVSHRVELLQVVLNHFSDLSISDLQLHDDLLSSRAFLKQVNHFRNLQRICRRERELTCNNCDLSWNVLGIKTNYTTRVDSSLLDFLRFESKGLR